VNAMATNSLHSPPHLCSHAARRRAATSRKNHGDVKGEIWRLKETVNHDGLRAAQTGFFRV